MQILKDNDHNFAFYFGDEYKLFWYENINDERLKKIVINDFKNIFGQSGSLSPYKWLFSSAYLPACLSVTVSF